MKKLVSLTLALACASVTLHAQSTSTLKKIMELKMARTVDDEKPGTRGASVAWHPVQKKYYAVFAGNIAYPLGVFDIKGNRLSPDELSAMIDTRGIWYNPVTKSITGNAFDFYGWFSYKLDSKGIPEEITTIMEGMNQPSDQSVGAYNPTSKRAMFLFGGQVIMYDKDGVRVDSLAIHFNRKKADGPGDEEDIFTSPEDYNYTTVIYTGIKGSELGFLNITNKEIELYDLKTGYMSKKLALPENATTEMSFNFAYANGMYWLFDMELRKWVAYK